VAERASNKAVNPLFAITLLLTLCVLLIQLISAPNATATPRETPSPFIQVPIIKPPSHWQGDLNPMDPDEWTRDHAKHLLERAGFGGTPEEIDHLFSLGLRGAVQRLVYFTHTTDTALPDFEHSGVFKPSLDPFPSSRPATTAQANKRGEALGIAVAPGGNRPMQAVVNEFFYWLRASQLETDRVAYWWALRMLITEQPLQEKIALFWHGHFATNEDKVRDYRKMLGQLRLFQEQGLGDFRTLLIGIAQDPAMLAFLDAGVNVKGSPNENFAREIMELFTMGVGHYTEEDVREAARAFTGWNYRGLTFHINESQHDDGNKHFLGEEGPFDGVDIIDRIVAQPQTADFIATKLYRYFVSEEVSPTLQKQLGTTLMRMDYQLRPFLSWLFSSRDFYYHQGARIKGPVDLVISTFRKLALTDIPGNPDFNETTARLGQYLLHPPTVAGWSQGRHWITAGLLFERSNFILDTVFPDIAFIPPDRYPKRYANILPVHKGLRNGLEISQATQPEGMIDGMAPIAASNLEANKYEDFNTRYGSYRGWQMAIEKVKPIPRNTAAIDLSAMIETAGLEHTEQVVPYLVARFMTIAPDDERLQTLTTWLTSQLGTTDLHRALTYREEALRKVLHALLSQPEYQLH
jgi:hypothetical protein